MASSASRGARSTAIVAVGVALAGLTTYAFLVLVARALGPSGYAPFAVGWSVALVIGSGLFSPLEQETARRTAHARAVGDPVAPQVLVMGTVSLLAAAGGASLLLLTALLPSPVLRPGTGVWWALLAVTAAYAVQMPVRGVLSGTGRFPAYGGVLAVEGTSRAAAAGLLVVLGSRTPALYLLLVAAGSVASLVAAWSRLPLRPRALSLDERRQLRRALRVVGLLALGAVAAQLLINLGPVLVTVLAAPGESGAASRFLAGMSLVRVPLFLFTAVQATLIPRLTADTADGNLGRFRRELGVLAGVIIGITVVAVVACLAVGEAAVRLLFGAGFELPGRDLAVLAVGVGAYLGAMSAAAALVSLDRHVAVLRGWTVGLLAMGVTTALVPDLIARVVLGFAVGAAVAAVWQTGELVAVRRRVRAGAGS